MNDSHRDALMVTGGCAVVLGIALLSIPLGVIVFGGLCIAASIFADRKGGE